MYFYNFNPVKMALHLCFQTWKQQDSKYFPQGSEHKFMALSKPLVASEQMVE